ncbi:MAG: response regulator [Actinomycetota bacterium]|nr:response regulator [Actinomycetota bacterium]
MPKCILLIDDEDHIREVAQISLEAVGGWEVLSSDSGVKGAAVAGNEQPDAILLDVMMPEMDGPTTLQRLKSDGATRSIPVIFMTAKAQSGDRLALEKLDVAGVIIKPFDPLTLSEQVSEVLGWGA